MYHSSYLLFFFNDTATTEIYTLSLHDALPIYAQKAGRDQLVEILRRDLFVRRLEQFIAGELLDDELIEQLAGDRSEEHTSELQSLAYLVCRLLLEKKKKKKNTKIHIKQNDQLQ